MEPILKRKVPYSYRLVHVDIKKQGHIPDRGGQQPRPDTAAAATRSFTTRSINRPGFCAVFFLVKDSIMPKK